MKKRMWQKAGLCVALAMLVWLAGCGNQEVAKIDPKDQTTPASTEDNEVTEDHSALQEENEDVPDLLALTTEDELVALLTGFWRYLPDEEGANGLGIEFTADGMFHMMREDPQSANGGVEYTGDWKMEHVFTEENEPPDLLCTTLTGNNDPLLDGFGGIGDFLISDYTVCDGNIMLYFVQANNGDSVFSMVYNKFDGVWIKVTDEPLPLPTDQVRCDDSFCAMAWKKETKPDGTRILWLDDLDAENAMKNAHRHEAVSYELAEDVDERFGFDSAEPGHCLAVETDADGNITMLNWYWRNQDMEE